MPERLKGPVLKTGVVERPPWVRIPAPPLTDFIFYGTGLILKIYSISKNKKAIYCIGKTLNFRASWLTNCFLYANIGDIR